jgi:hypothetical protein
MAKVRGDWAETCNKSGLEGEENMRRNHMRQRL